MTVAQHCWMHETLRNAIVQPTIARFCNNTNWQSFNTYSILTIIVQIIAACQEVPLCSYGLINWPMPWWWCDDYTCCAREELKCTSNDDGLTNCSVLQRCYSPS